MAGAGFKDFAVGEVLTASDVDTYLMQQSVMRFADAAARGSALGTAVGAGTALAEGMVSYLDDTNVVQVYDGSGWTSPMAGIGSNVVYGGSSTVFGTTSASFVNDTTLEVVITPTSATSKILFIYTGTLRNDTSGDMAVIRARRTVGGVTTEFGQVSETVSRTGDDRYNQSIVALDSPASTSALTYGVVIRQQGGGQAESLAKQLVLIEVAA